MRCLAACFGAPHSLVDARSCNKRISSGLASSAEEKCGGRTVQRSAQAATCETTVEWTTLFRILTTDASNGEWWDILQNAAAAFTTCLPADHASIFLLAGAGAAATLATSGAPLFGMRLGQLLLPSSAFASAPNKTHPEVNMGSLAAELQAQEGLAPIVYRSSSILQPTNTTASPLSHHNHHLRTHYSKDGMGKDGSYNSNVITTAAAAAASSSGVVRRHYVAVGIPGGSITAGMLVLSAIGPCAPSAWQPETLRTLAALLAPLLRPPQVPLARRCLAELGGGGTATIQQLVWLLAGVAEALTGLAVRVTLSCRVALVRQDGTAAAVFSVPDGGGGGGTSMYGASMSRRRSQELVLVDATGTGGSSFCGKSTGDYYMTVDRDSLLTGASRGAFATAPGPLSASATPTTGRSPHMGIHPSGAPAGGGTSGGAAGGCRAQSLPLQHTLLSEALSRGAGLCIADCNAYVQDSRVYPRDLMLFRGTAPPQSLALATCSGSEGGRPLLALYATYNSVLPQALLQSVVQELGQLLRALTPAVATLLGPGGPLAAEWRYLHDELLAPAAVAGGGSAGGGGAAARLRSSSSSTAAAAAAARQQKCSSLVVTAGAAGTRCGRPSAEAGGGKEVAGPAPVHVMARATPPGRQTQQQQPMQPQTPAPSHEAAVATQGSAWTTQVLFSSSPPAVGAVGAAPMNPSSEQQQQRHSPTTPAAAAAGAGPGAAVVGGSSFVSRGMAALLRVRNVLQYQQQQQTPTTATTATGTSPCKQTQSKSIDEGGGGGGGGASSYGGGGGGAHTEAAPDGVGLLIPPPQPQPSAPVTMRPPALVTVVDAAAAAAAAAVLKSDPGCEEVNIASRRLAAFVAGGGNGGGGDGRSSGGSETGNRLHHHEHHPTPESNLGPPNSQLSGRTSFLLEATGPPRGGLRLAPLISTLHERLKSAQVEQLTCSSRAACRLQDLSSLRLLERVGQGGYGSVYRGLYHGAEVAVKVVEDLTSQTTTATPAAAAAPGAGGGAGGDAGAGAGGGGGVGPSSLLRPKHLHDALELVASVNMCHPNIVQLITHFVDVRAHPGGGIRIGTTPTTTRNSGPAGGPPGTPTAAGSTPATPGGPHGGCAAVALGEEGGAVDASRVQQQQGEEAVVPPHHPHLPPAAAAAAVAAAGFGIGIGVGLGCCSCSEEPEPPLQLVHMRSSGLDSMDGSVSGPIGNEAIVLVMEFCDRGSLKDAILGGAFWSRPSSSSSSRMMMTMKPLLGASSFSRQPLLPLPPMQQQQQQQHKTQQAACGSGGGGMQSGGAGVQGGGAPGVLNHAGVLLPNMKAVYSTLLEIALALRHMHSLHLVHCDLKPQNVLLKSSPRDPRGFTAKLSDFGLSKMLEADEEGQLVIDDGIQSGTITHLPPEVLQGRRQLGPAVDIYAFGIVMFQMLCGMTVYRGLDMKQVIRGVVRHGLRPIFPSWVPHEYRDLAQRCWQVQPSLRPASLQLVAELESLLQATQQAAVAMGRGGGDGASLASLLTTTASSNAIKAAAAAAAAPTLQAAPAAAPVGAATIATTMTTTTDGIQAGPAAGAGGNGGGGGSVAAADRNAPYIVYQPPQQLYRPATTGGATRRATATGTVPTGSV